ncbi:MAG: hypothetical protein ACLFU8_00890 [Anaerolineales bacterium]
MRLRALLVCALIALLLLTGTARAQAPVTIEQAHLFIRFAEDRLEVQEFHLLSNAGEEPYTGGVDPDLGVPITALFELPPGAADLRFADPAAGERFVLAPEGFADTLPIPPGESTAEVRFTYALPYRPGEPFSRTFSLPVGAVVVVLPAGELEPVGEVLAYQGEMPGEGLNVDVYVAGSLAAGEALTLSLVPPEAVTPARPPAEVGLGAALLGLCLLASLWLWLWRPSPTAPPESVRPLLAEVAALDARFEAGALAEEVYRRERAALKAEVRSRCL